MKLNFDTFGDKLKTSLVEQTVELDKTCSVRVVNKPKITQSKIFLFAFITWTILINSCRH